MHNILDFNREELKDFLQSIEEKPFRATQIFEWIYQKGVWSFDEMKNLSKELCEKLSQDFILKPLKILKKETSKDGTTKFLFELDDKERIETVLIPTAKRTTVCLSTQAGCKFGCKFCASGIGGWKRDLSPAEILGQILSVKQSVSHIVFMGVGEPLDNYKNLLKAIRIINAPYGFKIGARRITISTCGLIPQIKKLMGEGLQIELSVSLHGADQETRDRLMPVNKKYPLKELIRACREYSQKTKRQVTFEYILIKDITCTEEAARNLGRLMKGILSKINLIVYNEVSEFDYQVPSRREVNIFRKVLTANGVHHTMRTPRGRDVAAACGQLRHCDKTI